MRSKTAFVVGLGVLVLVVSACGDDDSDGGDQPGGGEAETLSKQEVIARGDELCTEFRETLNRLQSRTQTRDLEEQAEAIDRIADKADEVADEFDSIDPPSGDAAFIDRYVSRSREQVDLLREAADLLAQGDPAKAEVLIESNQGKAAEVRRMAQGYGFKVCGSEGE